MLNKEQIFKANDIEQEKVEVPEWDGHVFVRAMNGAQRDSFEVSFLTGDKKKKNMENIRARLLVRTIVDEQGNRVFDDNDMEELGKKSGKVLDRLYEVAQRLCGISEGDVEELEKNS